MPKWLSDEIAQPNARSQQKQTQAQAQSQAQSPAPAPAPAHAHAQKQTSKSSQTVSSPSLSGRSEPGSAITDQNILPLQHVAIIMDGNRRWADLHGRPRFMGHKEGVKSLKRLVQHVGRNQLGYLTVYAFSSENWQRSKEEVRYLFELFAKVLTEEFDELSDSGVKLSFLGNLSQIPEKLANQLEAAMHRSKDNNGLSLQIAINYGSRLEICEAVQKIAADVSAGKLAVEKIDDALISSYLYTKHMPDPELIIRTGGEMRLSNYLLWQAAYTELYVTDVLWPDFTPDDFDRAIAEFSRRIRRYGGD